MAIKTLVEAPGMDSPKGFQRVPRLFLNLSPRWTHRTAVRGLMILLLLPGLSTAHAAEFAFNGLVDLALSYRPVAAKLVDLDADGDLDLVVVNTGEFADNQWNGSSIRVWLNKGPGLLEDPTTYPVPSAPYDLAVCDLDGDGSPDLATANAAPDNLSVLLNDGRGRFSAGAIVPVGTDPVSIVCRDFDRDGDMDLASADQFGFDVAVAFNRGHAVFSRAVRYPLGDLVNSIEGGDVDNDGDDDLIVMTNSATLLLRNNGLGVFDPSVLLLPGGLGRPTLCPVDTDPNLDLVTSDTVFFGNGTGEFDPAGVGTGLTGTRARCHDFDGDGTLEILTGSGIAFFAGTRAPGTRLDLPAASYPSDVAVGDFNGDLSPDVVRLHGGVAGPIGFATLIPGHRWSAEEPRRFTAGDSVWAMVSGSIGPDPHPDLAVINVGTGPSYLNGSVSLLSGLGDGTFSPGVAYDAGARTRAGAIADIDGDSLPDIVVTNYDAGTVSLLANDAHGGLAFPVSRPAGEYPEALSVGDLDGDGDADIVAANSTVPGKVSVLPGDGKGGFAAPISYAVTCDRPVGVSMARLDPDAYPDLAIVCSGRPVSGTWINAGMSVLRNKGDGTFGSAVPYPMTYLPRAIDACDIDRDGDIDLAVGSFVVPGKLLFAARIQVFLNNGSGAFPASVITDITNDHFAVRCSDLNGDGHADVAIPYLSGDVVSLLPGRGDGSFGPAEHFAVGIRPRGVVLEDVDADGLPDLAVASGGSNDVSVMLNRGPLPTRVVFREDAVTLSWPPIPTATGYNVYRGNISSLRDADRDGLPDAGYGECQNDRDTTPGGLFDTVFQDSELPSEGNGFFYLVTFNGAAGENGLGQTSSGRRRIAALPCP